MWTRSYDNSRTEYILSGGKRGDKGYQPRDWSMYKDKNLNEKGYISDIHIMTYNEALAITESASSTNGIRNTGACYWLATAYWAHYGSLCVVYNSRRNR